MRTSAAMIPVGYLYKYVAPRPDWLQVDGVRDVFSLSNCISRAFADYIGHWRHNGYWLFDAPAIMEEIAAQEGIDLSGAVLFYYEAYECEFDEHSGAWSAFAPEPSFATDVRAPADRRLAGFDVATFFARTSPECSPLSCNALATEVPVNEHCLLRTFDEARAAIERGAFNNTEPGPHRIFAVYEAGAG